MLNVLHVPYIKTALDDSKMNQHASIVMCLYFACGVDRHGQYRQQCPRDNL